jgi:hypothetical protein
LLCLAVGWVLSGLAGDVAVPGVEGVTKPFKEATLSSSVPGILTKVYAAN